MCVGIPLKVVRVEKNNEAIVSLGSSTMRIVTIFTPEVKEGDYVIVHAGFSISIVDEKETMEINSILSRLDES